MTLKMLIRRFGALSILYIIYILFLHAGKQVNGFRIKMNMWAMYGPAGFDPAVWGPLRSLHPALDPPPHCPAARGHEVIIIIIKGDELLPS
jgi:hypothetical protein